MKPYTRKFTEDVGELPNSENCVLRFVEINGDKYVDNHAYTPYEDLKERYDLLPESWTVEDFANRLMDRYFESFNDIGTFMDEEPEEVSSIAIGCIPDDGGTLVNVYRYTLVHGEDYKCINIRPMKGN